MTLYNRTGLLIYNDISMKIYNIFLTLSLEVLSLWKLLELNDLLQP